jgi:hypothetical protein
MSLFYGNGGPGPHTKLYRVDAPPGCDDHTWWAAAAFQWSVTAGWFEDTDVQGNIRWLGEFFRVDDSEVPDAMAQMLARYMAIQ